MIRYKDLHIPKPCLMNYNSFEQGNENHFCQNCEQDVFDFRGKDEKYLNKIIKGEEKVCGIFHKDQLNTNPKKVKSSFFNHFGIQLLSTFILIKSFLVIQESNASAIALPIISRGMTDSSRVKLIYKKVSSRTRHQISIYVNNTIILESTYPSQGYIYLPDTLKQNDKIKIKVSSPNIIKPKTYHFRYSEAETYTIKIVGKNEFKLLKKPYVMGYPTNLW